MQTSKNAGYTKTIVKNGLINQGSIKHAATSRLTSLEPSRRPEYPQGHQRLKAMQWTYTLHKPMQHFSPRCSRTTPWLWRISKRLHKPTEHQSRFLRRQYQSYRSKSLTSPQNSRHQNTRMPGWKIGTLFNPGQARTLGVQKFNPVRSKLKPRPKCVLQERTKIRPQRVLILSWIQYGGSAHVHDLSLTK